ncbi:peptide ABC transporter substrate-binding protein [Sulfobacillus thermosulfidooxidans]|uniref:peptide ABC transporter substrate-binding protein n=1 Tax=Sulfobacillus thermosulfidooxidans TaxID=28034 RepID=UPI0006B463E8|nr:peptide ABC transporter substrate-binding protein [Sulfobacillus thermosulfidooxidans]
MNKKSLAAMTPLVLIAAGCGTQSTTSSPALPTTATIALAPQVSPNWWFPVLSSSAYSDTNLQMNALMYVPLLHISRTDSIDFSRSLAQKISHNADGTVYTIDLNPKYHWSNGQPVTARDVVFTWQILKATSSGASNLPWGYGGAGTGGIPTDWASVVAKSPYTVVVTLKKPANPEWFEHNGLGQIEPVPAAIWDKYPHNMIAELQFIKSVANTPQASVYNVVDGPYHFTKMEPNQYWMFTANSHYDGHKSTLKHIVFEYETSSANEFAGLKTGKIDYGYLPPSLWNSRHQLTQDTFFPGYLFGFNYLQPNLNPSAPGGLGKVFDHAYIRQALEMGIDQQGIINTFYHGYGVTETDPIPPKPHTVFYDAALQKPLYPFNPEQGKRLLEKHGWQLHNGVMTKNGIPLSFTLLYVSGSNTDTSIVQLIKQDWAQEGIQVKLETQPFDTVLSTAQQTDATKWNMAWWGGGWTYEPDYYPTGGSFYATGAGANQGGYNNPEMDQLIQDSYKPGTPTQIKHALDAYLAYARQQVPVIWLPWTPTFNEHINTLHGTAKTFNPITALIYPNYWTFSQ